MRVKARLVDSSANTTPAPDRPDEPVAFDPTLDAIRAVVDQDETPQDTAAGDPPLSAAARVFVPLRDAPVVKSRPTRKEPGLILEPDPDATLRPTPREALRAAAHWLFRRVIAFLKRPDAPRWLSIALLLVLIVLRPGLVAFMFAMALLGALVLYFSIGPDQVESFVFTRFQRLRARDPEAAEKLRQRAARVSRAVSAIVGILPDRWTEGLHIPEFEEPQELPEKMKADPFERLLRE